VSLITIRECGRCGNLRDLSLTVVNYSDQGDRIYGRLLVYCNECLEESPKFIGISIPIEQVDQEVIKAIYRSKLSDSDPGTFLKFICGIEDSDLVQELEGLRQNPIMDDAALSQYRTD
jgi:hypothetical protein